MKTIGNVNSMQAIQSWEDVKPFAGKVVAFSSEEDPTKNPYFNHSRGFRSESDPNLQFGYIKKKEQTWCWPIDGRGRCSLLDEQGFALLRMIIDQDRHANCGLTNQTLKHRNVSMRVATQREIFDLMDISKQGYAGFEFIEDEKITNTILAANLFA